MTLPFRTDDAAADLLRALDGSAAERPESAALAALGRAVAAARPGDAAPDPFFASRLKATLMDSPPLRSRLPLARLLVPAGVVALAAVALIALPRGGAPSPVSPASLGAALTLAVGTVESRTAADAPWTPVAEGTTLAAGTELRTGADSRAVVTLDDGSAIRLNGKTVLALAALARDAVAVTEDSGTAYFRVAKDPARTFTVRTAEGTVTALGTAFAVARDKGKKTLEVHGIENKVKVVLAKDGTTLEKELAEGKTLTYDAAKPPDVGTAVSDIDPAKIAEVPFFNWNLREDAREKEPLGIVKEVPKVAVAIANPANGAKLPLGPVTVAGTTLPGMTVAVNGVETTSGDDGAWKVVLEPAKGALTLTIVVKDPLAGDRTERIGVTVGEEPKVAAPPAPSSGIAASAAVSGTSVKVLWTVAGVDVSKGFKVVKSLKANPVYPGDAYHYLSNPDARKDLWTDLSPLTTYHFRVCSYDGAGKCLRYSNDVAVKTGEGAVKQPATGYVPISGELALSVGGGAGGIVLEWTQRSASDFQYYKVVRSETDADPYYPKSGYIAAIGDRGTTRVVDAKAVAGKTYYYRVCSVEPSGVSCGNVVKYLVR